MKYISYANFYKPKESLFALVTFAEIEVGVAMGTEIQLSEGNTIWIVFLDNVDMDGYI
jgi:hypothetical protein